MKRQLRAQISVVLCGAVLAGGCAPTQPFYFFEDGDLSHYLDVATQIEYPDVHEPQLDEVTSARAPLTLRNAENYEMWDLTLEEATRITLCNSQVMRQLGGRTIENAPETISRTLVSSVAVTTTYDPALVETATGSAFGSAFGGTGVEAALSEFDAQLDSSIIWRKNDTPQNRLANPIFPANFEQDQGIGTLGITKTTAVGSQVSIRNNTNYEWNNTPTPPLGTFRAYPSDWQSNFEAGFRHPLLQGSGAQYNRIAGPQSFEQYAANITNPFDGVMIARIRTDQSLADFEGGVRNLMRDVEAAYWELYFTYRDLESRKTGRDSGLETWKKVKALFDEGAKGGSADREAQARSQYFQFKALVEQGLTDLYRAESRLRFIMGLSMSDGRLIRPADEPTTAQVAFDWDGIHTESLMRRVEVRKQKWEVKKRELELIAARNGLLPRLDATGTYRWRGLGDDLIGSSTGLPPNAPGSNAFEVLTDGQFQEWELGLQLSVPIGFRRQLSTIRHHQLALARERALLQDLELEVSHQLGDAIRDLDLNYGLTETNFNRRVAAERDVEATQAAYDASRLTLDLLLNAQQRRAEAETAYYRSLVDYNLSVSKVHYRKGSLLDYNGVYLAEGPWPGKAYFDAMRRARQRDAALQLDYGFTRPNVMSRGVYDQNTGAGCTTDGCPMPQYAPGMEYAPQMAPTNAYPVPTPAEGFPTSQQTPQGVGQVTPVSYNAPSRGQLPAMQ
ncbi:Outer membrane efflux protein [Pirellulimonas nuda]|uniref:Outer membrane efflux protein n=1 Tax=Pirellulimonas nuda TaxID=2528009 RepID=A0A518DI54_9BACT|nr:TolC family protein [Pirellulimonas nuda]QDU91159.1 Outer membrane efflux protein [Pirellulimonas nuda]